MKNQNFPALANKNTQASHSIVLLSAREMAKMRRVGQLAASLLNYLEPMVRPGISTQKLDAEAARWMTDHNATSATLGYAPPGHSPFRGSICTSVNNVVCHGIPSSNRILRDGDIINIDVSPILEGYYGDTSRTFCVGHVSETARKLVEVAQESMMRGIAQIKPGARLGDIGAAVEGYAESNGFSIVRDMVGHGIGREFHMEPQVLHYGKRGTGLKLRPGMVFTVEPILNEGSSKIKLLADGWTMLTKDKKLSAQFEHTVAVTEEGSEILTVIS